MDLFTAVIQDRAAARSQSHRNRNVRRAVPAPILSRKTPTRATACPAIAHWSAGDGRSVTVYLDGVPIPLAVRADVSRGLVESMREDADGNILKELGRPSLITLHGAVRIQED